MADLSTYPGAHGKRARRKTRAAPLGADDGYTATPWEFLTATRGGAKLHWTDWASYAYLSLGIFLMFFPVVWLVLSSFKTEADLQRYPPTFLPYQQQTMRIEGYDDPLPLFA
jgi:ABC-type glycerol-3-phosphate transport system permease component